MKTGITKQYDGNFPERNLVSNQEQGAQEDLIKLNIDRLKLIRNYFGEHDMLVSEHMNYYAAGEVIKFLESYRTQSTGEESEQRGNHSITVKSIDVYGLEARLRKDKTKEGKETYNYIKQLKEVLKNQQDLTAKAISKIRELSAQSTEVKTQRAEAIRKKISEVENIMEGISEFDEDLRDTWWNYKQGLIFALESLQSPSHPQIESAKVK